MVTKYLDLILRFKYAICKSRACLQWQISIGQITIILTSNFFQAEYFIKGKK